MDNIFTLLYDNYITFDQVDYFDLFDQVDQVDYKGARELIFKRLTASLPKVKMVNLVNLRGRSLELGYLLALVSTFVGLDVDIVKLTELARETLEEIREIGIPGALRDWLVRMYKDYKTYKELRNRDGEFMLANKDVYDKFNDYLMQTRKQKVGVKRFKAILMDLGFTGEARKKMKIKLLEELDEVSEPKTRLACIFTERVCRRLGLDYRRMVEEGKALIEQETLEVKNE